MQGNGKGMLTRKKKRVVSFRKKIYSYEDMKKDIEELRGRYGRILDVTVLERSPDQRNIYCIRIGNPLAENVFIVDVALHGREWLNTQVCMRILENYCRNISKKNHKGKCYQEVSDKVCLYLLPMMNPDGVSISQYGVSVIKDNRLRKGLMDMPKESYYRWKANARGVDLNRNFEVRFGENPVKQPAAEEYGGEMPMSEPETKALARLVCKVHPKALIHYHEAGSQIFYERESSIVKIVHQITRYPLKKEKKTASGCFSTWLEGREISSCTVETCWGKAPVPYGQIVPVYLRNRKLLIQVMKKGLHYQ